MDWASCALFLVASGYALAAWLHYGAALRANREALQSYRSARRRLEEAQRILDGVQQAQGYRLVMSLRRHPYLAVIPCAWQEGERKGDGAAKEGSGGGGK